MTRREARENAFFILFEQCFNSEPVNEIIELAVQERGLTVDDYCKTIVIGVNEKQKEVDALFEPHIIGWKKSRLSKTAISILRIACYEIVFLDDIPLNVSISEAFEISKKYGGDEEASFINGILGSFARSITGGEPPVEIISNDSAENE